MKSAKIKSKTKKNNFFLLLKS